MAKTYSLSELAKYYAPRFNLAEPTVYEHLRSRCKFYGREKPYRATRKQARHWLTIKYKN